MPGYPQIIFTEEVMREGMQIEAAAIPVEAKIALLDKLSTTGLKNIVVGSFVSPKYTPQMKQIELVLAGFTPNPAVNYTAMIPNERGRERARAFAPPLNLNAGPGVPRLNVHLCDVFTRRNFNRSQMQEMAGWTRIVATARAQGAKAAGIGVNATFGSNFLGDFPVDVAMLFFEKQHALWDAAGIPVTSIVIADPMGWCHPAKIEDLLGRILARWPAITDFRCHLHNSRGMALTSTYAAIRCLDARHTLRVEGTLGGIGGCPYNGNGQATGMMPTEDFMHMLEGMGIETGVDLDALIECVWLLEDILGRQTWGHVSRAGARPSRQRLYSANAPFVETLDQARHFKLGPQAYAGGIVPWEAPITSPYLERLEQGWPLFEADGGWPWQADFFPRVEDVLAALPAPSPAVATATAGVTPAGDEPAC